MSVDEKVACGVNAVVGGLAGAAIFVGAVGGFEFLVGRAPSWWNGWVGLALCVVGAAVGVASYFQRHVEYGTQLVKVYSGWGGGWLLMRRIRVLVFGLVAAYFLWELARGI